MDQKYSVLASLDVGTSTIRCLLIDKKGCILGESKRNVKLHMPKPGFVEISPDEMWDDVLTVINEAVQGSNVTLIDISAIGISCQRNSFILWNKHTKTPYCNFITWNDLRAAEIVKKENSSFKMRSFRLMSRVLYLLTRRSRFLVGSMYKLTNNQITPKLMWILNNNNTLANDLSKNIVMLGTMDTWLLHKLSGGNLHVTDMSHASSTGLFDPFTLQWSQWPFRLFGIPNTILPVVVDSAGAHFGFVDKNIFGFSIPIYCSIADQSSSLFGSCCFKAGETKLTLGTGTFLNVNTGCVPAASFRGLYPLVAWKYNEELVYMAEGASNDTGITVKWAQQLGLCTNLNDSSKIAESVENSNGVYFVPAFSGIQIPVNDANAAAGFIGLKLTTKKTHLLRAILDSIVYRIYQLFECYYQETHFSPTYVRVDGGVSVNEFIMQRLADTLNLTLLRANTEEMSALGAAFLAGLKSGFWKEKSELRDLVKVNAYIPKTPFPNHYKKDYLKWCNAVNRLSQWYD